MVYSPAVSSREEKGIFWKSFCMISSFTDLVYQLRLYIQDGARPA